MQISRFPQNSQLPITRRLPKAPDRSGLKDVLGATIGAWGGGLGRLVP
ncbi:hypothetical protein IV102_10720 [bacterium]|nr:hypothetical protein [bacterium]